MPLINPKQGPNQTGNTGGSHLRSLSQPIVFGTHGLPPLSPYPPSDTSRNIPNSNLKNISMEELDATSMGSATTLPSPRENPFLGGNRGLPLRRGHCRSNSDVALGFSAMIQSPAQLIPISSPEILGQAVHTPMNLENDKPVENCGKTCVDIKQEGEVDELLNSVVNMDCLNMSGTDGKDKDSISSGSKMSYGDGSNSDSETASRHCRSSQEGLKRSADGDIVPPFRHSRSLSMDSGTGKFLFEPNMQISLCNPLSPSNLLNENLAKINLNVFSEAELKKIMTDERLAELAMSDPKRVKRILANRQSAARSKERKMRYISELEHKVQTLQTEATTLSAKITTLQNNHTELVHQNNELKLRVQAMEQQAHHRDALHETLQAEIQRLKIANVELRDEVRASISMARYANIKHTFPMKDQYHPSQMQQLSGTTSNSSTTTSAVLG